MMYALYEITLRGYDGHSTVVTAETSGKAKYQHYLELGDVFDDFATYLAHVASCVRAGKTWTNPRQEQLEADFAKVARYRGVAGAKIGMLVELNGKTGQILRANDSANFDIAFQDGVYNCHPHHNLVYFNTDGSILYDFRPATRRNE